jgi:hypothetical protein
MSLSRAHHQSTSPPYILSPRAVHHLQRPQTRESHLRQLKEFLVAQPLLLQTPESYLQQLKTFLAAQSLLLQTRLHSPAPQLVTH